VAAAVVAPATTMIKPGLFMITGIGGAQRWSSGSPMTVWFSLIPAHSVTRITRHSWTRSKPYPTSRSNTLSFGDVHQDKSGGTGFLIKNGVQVIGHVNEKEGLKTYRMRREYRKRRMSLSTKTIRSSWE
jgi:hypothetical protein